MEENKSTDRVFMDITIKLNTNELINITDVLPRFNIFYVQKQIDEGKDIINFGLIGVRRSLLEWFKIEPYTK